MAIRVLLRNLFRRERVERDLDDELRSYLQLLVAEKVSRGVPLDRARRDAWIELGGLDQVKEQVRDVRKGALVEQLLQDVRYGVRVLGRNRLFTAVAVATLALGIGANAAIFGIVNSVLLRPLPFGAPDALFAIEGLGYTGEFVELQRRATTFDVASHVTRLATVTGAAEPVRLAAASVSPNFMSLLQTAPALGRTLQQGDERAVSGEVLVISHQLWRSRFGGDPGVIGRSITLDGQSRTVVGVMPERFAYPSPETQVWTAALADEKDRVALWSSSRRLIGRLRTGASLAQADAELESLGPSMRSLFPWGMPANYGASAAAVPLHQSIVQDVRPLLLLLLGAALVVLLIACVNVSHLLVGRTLARGRELGIRAALGAARPRILRQVWTEGGLVVLLGLAAAMPVAYLGVKLLALSLPAEMPRPAYLAVDLRLLAFAALAAAGSTLIIGGLPAFRASRLDLRSALVDGGRHGHGRAARWTSNVLVAGQMALAVTLVVTAILLVRSLANLYAVTPGFTASGVVSARVSPPQFRYRAASARRAFYQDVLDRLNRLPGTEGAALTDRLPFGGEAFGSVFIIEGRPDPRRTGEWPLADVSAIVSPTFFSTLGIPVIEGRVFSPADTDPGQRVVVIDETLARKYWPGESPVGRRFSFPGDPAGARTIVGVVGEVKWERVTDSGKSAIFAPLAQSNPGAMRLVVRADTGGMDHAAQIRAAIRGLDADTPVDQVRSLDALVAGSVAQPQFAAWLVGVLASAGLLLGAIGVYGTVADHVTRRRREIGVRVALGATRVDVYRSVLGGTLVVVATGAGAGLAGAALTTRLVDSLLFGVSSKDPLTFTGAAILLAATALAAAFIPARRASSLDPLVVLKGE